MSEKPRFDVPIEYEGQSLPELLDQLAWKAQAQIEEVQSTGAIVTRIQVVQKDAPEIPLRYHIKFPDGTPQWEVRAKLEALLYDVGQKIGNQSLAFYATKRTEKSKGWST